MGRGIQGLFNGGRAVNKALAKKLAIVALIVAAAVAFKMLGMHRYLDLAYIKQSREGFALYYEQHAPGVIAAYMGAYVMVAALSLPGAAALSLLGGALFGFGVGTVAVSFASTMGATLACMASRYLLRDWVHQRMGARLGAINRGMEREGRFYLFTLRLIPIFPFFAVNLLMGLTRMPIRSFYWVSQLGMLPATMVYVNAGRELGRIESLSGVLSPGLIASFALLGIFPIAAKRAAGMMDGRKSGQGGGDG